MPDIEIGPETETQHNWQYPVRVFAQGKTHEFDVTLSFQDYNLWSGGRVPPSQVVQAAFKFLLMNEGPEEIMARFDCSVIRRYFPKVDQELSGLL